MITFEPVHMTEMLDMTEKLTGVEDRELLKQFEEVEQLPDGGKHVVKKLLDAFLTRRRLRALAR